MHFRRRTDDRSEAALASGVSALNTYLGVTDDGRRGGNQSTASSPDTASGDRSGSPAGPPPNATSAPTPAPALLETRPVTRDPALPGDGTGTAADTVSGPGPDPAGRQAPRPALDAAAAPKGRLARWFVQRRVRARIATIVVLPLLAALVFGGSVIYSGLSRAGDARTTATLADLATRALNAAAALQDERDLSARLAGGDAAAAEPLTAARLSADSALRTLTDEIARHDGLPGPATDAARKVAVLVTGLPDVRAIADSRPSFENRLLNPYSEMVGNLLELADQVGSSSVDDDLGRTTGALTSLARMIEAASVERAVVSDQLLRLGMLGQQERTRFEVLRGAQDLRLADFELSAAPATVDAYYRQVSPKSTSYVSHERALLFGGSPITAERWYDASTSRIGAMRTVASDLANTVADRAPALARQEQIIAGITILLTLFVLGVTLWLTLVAARSITGPLHRLALAAQETAEFKLPELVERIQAEGPAALRSADTAIPPETDDEIAEVAHAFNAVSGMAAKIAGDQALLRENLRAIFVNLSRRSQSLIERQLREVEGLEQTERDPERLSTLFRIDHLATRMRRHAESLLVLAESEAGRRTERPIGLLDVVRAAAGEVDQYERIRVGTLPASFVAPDAVADVVHLLAELLENALAFSPPDTPVTVSGRQALGGVVRLAIEDRGIGMSDVDRARLSTVIAEPGDVDVAASRTLGLHVVARLAARHGIRIRLEANGSQGTLAEVTLPARVVSDPLDPAGTARARAAEARAAAARDTDQPMIARGTDRRRPSVPVTARREDVPEFGLKRILDAATGKVTHEPFSPAPTAGSNGNGLGGNRRPTPALGLFGSGARGAGGALPRRGAEPLPPETGAGATASETPVDPVGDPVGDPSGETPVSVPVPVPASDFDETAEFTRSRESADDAVSEGDEPSRGLIGERHVTQGGDSEAGASDAESATGPETVAVAEAAAATGAADDVSAVHHGTGTADVTAAADVTDTADADGHAGEVAATSETAAADSGRPESRNTDSAGAGPEHAHLYEPVLAAEGTPVEPPAGDDAALEAAGVPALAATAGPDDSLVPDEDWGDDDSPIFRAIRSEWFRRDSLPALDEVTTSAAGDGETVPDEEPVAKPFIGLGLRPVPADEPVVLTAAGLPLRQRGTRPLPSAAPAARGATLAAPEVPALPRSADNVRGILTSLQRGVSAGRTTGPDPADEPRAPGNGSGSGSVNGSRDGRKGPHGNGRRDGGQGRPGARGDIEATPEGVEA